MDIADYQAGAYEQQYEYRSFSPTLISHDWVFSDSALLAKLSNADRALGELNAFSQLIPDIGFFIRTYVAKEATQSNRIEGTQTNIEDAFKDQQDLSEERHDDWREVQNYIQAINYAINRLDTLPLSNRLLCETHKILMSGARGERKMPGQFRVSQNWIGVSLADAVFVPPHKDRLAELMSDLERFLNDNERPVPPLIRIGIAHYQFETIHPFLDGNGRLGRLMISLYLAQTGLLSKPTLYLSDYFERNKTAYIDHLMAVRDGNHMRDWLMFFLHGVEETSRTAAAVFREILALKEQIEREVLPHFTTRRQPNVQRLVKNLYAKPVIDVKAVSELLETTPNTASSLITDLQSLGVLDEVTGHSRNRLFVFNRYLNLFKS